HALAGESEAVFRALDEAYERGFRTTWALDLRPHSLLYIDPIDGDPAFDSLRKDPRLAQWLARVRKPFVSPRQVRSQASREMETRHVDVDAQAMACSPGGCDSIGHHAGRAAVRCARRRYDRRIH